ncbi:CBS domain-containing protein [Halalkalibacter alkaliphilus]|uniref:CBS domain-containing protein n=1 Tax=Halalkalibacter alkaliphilus TaxID=2917993 RepID=A0A9X2CVT0_9BACI|nr:CBS domain-containing protein [Halalkalibacter alkaliphilus]MCL7749178.1 CBS domain-containing protein [Halalkalibacter alkaliphilus]
MDVIVSHVNLDFDGLGSMLAAKKLHPGAHVALTDKQHPTVKSYLAIYRDELGFSSYTEINWQHVRTLILVDVASLKRTGIPIPDLSPHIQFIVYDHHAPKEGDIITGERHIEQVGATVTLLTEQLHNRKMTITPFEATLFGLGIYTDTGNFTYPQTTEKDLFMASVLKKHNMDIALIDRFSEQPLSLEDRQLFQTLLTKGKEQYDTGVTLFLTTHEQPSYQSGLATLTRRLLESTDSDAAISIVKMKDHVYIVARASSERIDLRKLMTELGGGGHAQAASATLKRKDLNEVIKTVQKSLAVIIKPAITAAYFMASPVKSVSPYDTINEVLEQMYQYGHTGFPVVNDQGQLVGIISRRDVDKATHHRLGHAPVKGYMSTQPVTLPPDASLEEIQSTMMKHNIGRIPILSNDEMVGIISRTDIIEQLHKQTSKLSKQTIIDMMRSQLSKDIYKLLIEIGTIADSQGVKIYLIGGIVRDFILNRANEDIDLVIEGDGIAFANLLSERLGGQVKSHEKFGTATWKTTENVKIDIVTCRTEYYDAPAALPNVRASNIREDLRRRDFTINAMALQINKSHFGTLLDFFQGQDDIEQKNIRILHTLSFIEDPTRIIRAVRFALRFHYQLTEQTFTLAIDAVAMLKQVSAKRLLREFELLVKEGSIIEAIKMLDEIGVWTTLLGHSPTEEEIIKVNAILNEIQDPFFLFLTFAYHQKDWKRKVKFFALTARQNQIIQQLEILDEHQKEQLTTIGSIHQQFYNYTEETIFIYTVLTKNEMLHTYLAKRKNVKALLSGRDLIDRGIKPGPVFSNILHQLTCLQLDDQIKTKGEAITWLETNFK